MNPSAGGYHQQHQQPVAHHLDSKFAQEDYAQGSYVSSTGGEYFNHLNHSQSHQLQYGYHQHHHQATSTPYGASTAVPLNGGYPGYGGYYAPHHPHHPQVHGVHHPGMHSHHHTVGALAMPPEAQQPPLTCPANMQHQQSPVSASSVMGSISPGMMQQQQQDGMQHQSHLDNSACSPANSLHARDNSPELQRQHHHGQHLQVQHQEDMSDTDDVEEDQTMDGSPGGGDEEDEDEGEGDEKRVVYAWMKKVHVAGVGEFCLF